METKPDSDSPNEPLAEATNTPSVGATLRAAREAQGMKVADVADRIKFSVRQIEALEADDLPHLPEGAFLRGFIRSYARALHLDESALLATSPANPEPTRDVAASQAGGQVFPVMDVARQKSIYLLIGALFVALVLAVFVWSHEDGEADSHDKIVIVDVPLPELAAASAPEAAASSVTTAPTMVAATTVAAAEPNKPTPPAKPAQPVLPLPAVKPTLKTSVAATMETRSESAVAATKTLEQLKKRPIHIVFEQESWMEITDKNGVLLLSLTGTPGIEKWIGGRQRGPYQVSIGRPGAVRIYNRGREVDLSQYEPAELVHLVLE